MEQNTELMQIISTFNGNHIERWSKEGPDPSFYRQFSEKVEQFIVLSSFNLPKVQELKVVEREDSSFGVLPSPAKRAVARAMLSGDPIVPLRVYEEEKTLPPEIFVDTAYLHTILPVDPTHTASMKEQKLTIDTLLSIKNRIALKNSTIKGQNPSGEPFVVKVGELKGVLYLIKRGVVGNFSVEKISLSSPSDIENAISAYKESLSYVLQFNPSATPSRDSIGYEIINSQLEKEIEKEKEGTNINIPIVLDFIGYPYKKSPLLFSVSPGMTPNINLIPSEKFYGN